MLNKYINKMSFFITLNLGLLFTALGIAIFKTPNHFAFGGTSGISIILASLFPQWNVGTFMWVVNIILIILGFIFLGYKSMGWTIYSSLALSFFVSFIETIYPLSQPLTNDVLLELLFSVILPAVGSALVFNLGASTGGTDIVAMILHKYSSLEIGKALMCSDAFIVGGAFILYGPQTGLYCILGLIFKCTIVDMAIESLNLRKVCTIISDYPNEIESFIIHKLHRSATKQLAYGSYSQEHKTVLMSVLTRSEANALRNYVKTVDTHAFITIVNSSEIIGKGFRSI